MTPKPCPKCGAKPIPWTLTGAKDRWMCPNIECDFLEDHPREAWDALPRPSTESISSSVEETPETEAIRQIFRQEEVEDDDINSILGRVEAIERHRNALLRFIETIPHEADCDSLVIHRVGVCDCMLSRIPKP